MVLSVVSTFLIFQLILLFFSVILYFWPTFNVLKVVFKETYGAAADAVTGLAAGKNEHAIAIDNETANTFLMRFFFIIILLTLFTQIGYFYRCVIIILSFQIYYNIFFQFLRYFLHKFKYTSFFLHLLVKM